MAKERILVVDDERNIVELIKYNLEKEGYEVICAYDGIEAVNIAKQDRPDLIILDIMLPGQGGLEVTRILRREMRTPIIMANTEGDFHVKGARLRAPLKSAKSIRVFTRASGGKFTQQACGPTQRWATFPSS